jgi:hypothetical protein
MNRMIVKSRIGADGVLQVHVPVGAADANREVVVTIEPAVDSSTDSNGYSLWVRGIAGAWQGDFERPPQGTLEEREPLP